MKLRSAPLEDVFAELDSALRDQRTPAARLLRREAQRDYHALHAKYLRLLRATERGALLPKVRPR